MPVNFDILESNSFDWKDNLYLLMVCIQQKEYNRLETLKDPLNDLFKRGLIKLIQGKNEPNYLKVRLSDKGKKLLKDVSVLEISDESKKLAASLIELWENNGLVYQNKRKIISDTVWFLNESGYSASEVYAKAEDYINTNDKKYIVHLDNFFHKPQSVYQTARRLENSKIYSLLTKKS